MSIRYLTDENLDPLYKKQLLLKMPGLVVYGVGDIGTPLIRNAGPGDFMLV